MKTDPMDLAEWVEFVTRAEEQAVTNSFPPFHNLENDVSFIQEHLWSLIWSWWWCVASLLSSWSSPLASTLVKGLFGHFPESVPCLKVRDDLSLSRCFSTLAEVNVMFAGAGLSTVVISFIFSTYHNVVLCWSLFYMFTSFGATLPWTSCNNTWNLAENCSSGILSSNNTELQSASQQFFEWGILDDRCFIWKDYFWNISRGRSFVPLQSQGSGKDQWHRRAWWPPLGTLWLPPSWLGHHIFMLG